MHVCRAARECQSPAVDNVGATTRYSREKLQSCCPHPLTVLDGCACEDDAALAVEADQGVDGLVALSRLQPADMEAWGAAGEAVWQFGSREAAVTPQTLNWHGANATLNATPNATGQQVPWRGGGGGGGAAPPPPPPRTCAPRRTPAGPRTPPAQRCACAESHTTPPPRDARCRA